MRNPSLEQILAFLHEAEARSLREHAMMFLTWRHRLRQSEVCWLQLDDLDLEHARITIRGPRARVLPLAADEVRVLKSYMPSAPPLNPATCLLTSSECR
jgi:site-specific recombinase XerC